MNTTVMIAILLVLSLSATDSQSDYKPCDKAEEGCDGGKCCRTDDLIQLGNPGACIPWSDYNYKCPDGTTFITCHKKPSVKKCPGSSKFCCMTKDEKSGSCLPIGFPCTLTKW